jgi:hypothetical protein
MKRIVILAIATAICSTISAQLSVESNGKVSVQSTGNQLPTLLAVGACSGTYSGYKYGTTIHFVPVPSYRSMGIYSRTVSSNYLGSGRSFGVYGVGGNATSGYNYGVVGTISGQYDGAGIYGSSSDVTEGVYGQYAGYFRGATYVDGTLTATSVITPSDIRLKTNITNISDTDQTLENLMKINVLSYNYKKREIPEMERDTIQESTIRAYDTKWESDAKERHFGFSAQELKEIFPDLVKEGQDGYLGVNYVELVPLLLRSIQELKQELDEVKGEAKAITRSVSDETADFNAAAKNNVLYQNTPNPFKEQTIIRFSLEENVRDASICIFDMTGKMLKELPVSSGMENVSIGGYELGEGMFLYSLIVSGQIIDTKRMVISK